MQYNVLSREQLILVSDFKIFDLSLEETIFLEEFIVEAKIHDSLLVDNGWVGWFWLVIGNHRYFLLLHWMLIAINKKYY